jgi:hypothetical protein
MTTTVQRAEDVVNIGLAKIGYNQTVVDLYDGSRASRAALNCYSEIRYHTLYTGDWDFAERNIQGILLKRAPPSYVTVPWTPAYPSLPWKFEYAYPQDAVKIRGVKRPPMAIPNYDPRYERFSIDNDIGFLPTRKVILTNVANALLVYTGQILDPAQWDEGFIELVSDEIGKALGPVLMGADAFKIASVQEGQDLAAAEWNKQRG